MIRCCIALLGMVLALSACFTREEEMAYREVMYKVDTTPLSRRMRISYEDSEGTQAISTTDTVWRMKVRLPADKMPCLTVNATPDVDRWLAHMRLAYDDEGTDKLPFVPICVRIVRDGQEVRCTGFDLLYVSMDDVSLAGFGDMDALFNW